MLLIAALLCALCFTAHAQLKEEHFALFADDITFTDAGDSWRIEADGIPFDDDASTLNSEVNPNEPSEQMHSFLIHKIPIFVDEPTCTSLGPIGLSLNGVPFYNPYTGAGCDAVKYETFDDCLGHASPNGGYHYHQLSHCVHENEAPETPLKLHGVAIDGILIYGPLDADGVSITNDRLDECHGSSDILSNGQYAYFMNDEYPYIIGCYRGTVQNARPSNCIELLDDEEACSGGGPPPGNGGPPPGSGGSGDLPPSTTVDNRPTPGMTDSATSSTFSLSLMLLTALIALII